VAAALSDYTTLRLGGPASAVLEATSEQQLIEALRSSPALVFSGGSNLVVADDGVPGVALRIATRGVHRDGNVLTVAAGESWDELVSHAVSVDLAGIEALSGIPGSVGAGPIQNVGAYGQEVAQTVRSVRVYDRATDGIEEMGPAECRFGYRSSRFKYQDRLVVLSVTFELQPSSESMPIRYAELARALGVDIGDRAPLAAVRSAVLDLRRGKGMVIDPADPDSVSAGSFFTNPILPPDEFAAIPGDPPSWPEPDGRVKTSAAWLIQHAGFTRGYGDGRVGISSKHTLALVNRGGGTTSELIALAREIAERVRERFGVALHPEPVLVGIDW
jgi:UDP-N-acetylmuramate dehydrogenase